MVDLLYGPKEWPSRVQLYHPESEAIWMKFRPLWAKCWGLALADFGCNSHSSDNCEGAEILL